MNMFVNIKKLIKSMMPPLFVGLYKRYKYGKDPDCYWQGIYKHYRDVPQKGCYDNDDWINHIFIKTKQLILNSSQYETIPVEVKEEKILLPLLVSLLGGGNSGFWGRNGRRFY